MRFPVLVIAALQLSAPAFAQTSADPAPAGMADRPIVAHHYVRPSLRVAHHRALGSMRHPTVGNTANQRVNGG